MSKLEDCSDLYSRAIGTAYSAKRKRISSAYWTWFLESKPGYYAMFGVSSAKIVAVKATCMSRRAIKRTRMMVIRIESTNSGGTEMLVNGRSENESHISRCRQGYIA